MLAEAPPARGSSTWPAWSAYPVRAASALDIRLNLEMITRDPLKVPCLTEGYWATFADLPGRYLAHTLSLVRSRPASEHLPRISTLPSNEQLRAEGDNVRRCLALARDQLGE